MTPHEFITKWRASELKERSASPRDEDAAKELRKRTLTNLYNDRPQWLADAHAALDAAVANAYGWAADITDDDAVRELLNLNSGRQAEDPVRHGRH